MARIRTIKPEFFRHEELQSLGPVTMLVFCGLWTQCDKAGNFPWKPRQLKLDILPFIEYDIEQVLENLSTAGVVLKYVHEEKDYGHIPKFKTHQVIWGSELKTKTRYPDYVGRTSDVLRTVEIGVRSKEKGDTDKSKYVDRVSRCIELYPKLRELENGEKSAVLISQDDTERLLSLIQANPAYPFEFAIQTIACKTKRPKNLKGFLDEIPAIDGLAVAMRKELIARCEKIAREHPEVNRDVTLCEPFMDDETRILWEAGRG